MSGLNIVSSLKQGAKAIGLVLSLMLLLHGNICLANGPILEEDFFTVNIDDCDAMGDLCIDIPFGESSNYSFVVDGVPYSGMLAGCSFDTIFNYGYADVPTPGPYFLDSWIVNGDRFSGDFPDMFALVDSMNIWDPLGDWEINTMAQLIIGGHPGNLYSEMSINMLLLNSPTILDINIGIQPNGTLFSFESGIHEVVILEQLSGCLDTFQVAVSCIQSDIVSFDILQGESETHCFDFSELPGFTQNISNIHQVGAEPVATYTFVNGNSCVEIGALNIGSDTACIVYCDQLNFCDTTFIQINVTDGLMHTIDTSFVAVKVYNSSSFCFVDEFDGNSASTVMGCENGDETITFSALDAMNCVDYTANTLGEDIICVVFTDNAGNTHTSYLIVTVTPPNPEIIQETVLLGNTYSDCPDSSELNGNIVNVANICEPNTNNNVNFGINNVSLCLDAESVSIGLDTACIILCDDQGVCDTTTYIIEVIDNAQNTISTDDFITVSKNDQIDLDLCTNDQLFGQNITDFFIVSDASNGGPSNGQVAINQGCSITYTPNRDYCGNDSFMYTVCTANGCDTAIVAVNVTCEPGVGAGDDLLIYEGFSPNSDGNNDFFTIQGIENYPGNTLRIYNRWGQIVYEEFEYQNDWNGTWLEENLPDGTYFYALDLSRGEIMTGFVQIRR